MGESGFHGEGREVRVVIIAKFVVIRMMAYKV